MPQSLAAVYLHAVFSTKNRAPMLEDPGYRSEIHAYMAGTTQKLGCPAIEVGGFTDHVHMLVRFGRTITIADWLRETKRSSTSHVRETHPRFAWRAGYGVFAVAPEGVPAVAAYIRNQEDHHRTLSYQDELRTLMTEHGLQWDERYFWD